MTLEKDVPPYANRGAQNTLQEGLIACVDWLQVTFRHVNNPHDIVKLLDLESYDFDAVDIGRFGYSFHLRLGHIAIFYDDEHTHCHLEISGQGCREYESYDKYDWSVLLGLILMLDVNITRLDLAVDDFKGYFKISTLYRKLKSGHARSRFKTFRYMVQSKIAKKEITGQTVYLGSPASRLMIRFYDKLAERKNKNYEVDDGLTVWNRTELQLRDDRAYNAAVILSQEKFNTGQLIQGILKNYITFVNPRNDTNKNRWPVSDFWTKFLGDVEKLSLTDKSPEKDIAQIKSWFDVSMTATLAMLYKAFDENPSLLKEFIDLGNQKMSDRHEKLLKKWKADKELKDLLLHDKRVKSIGTRFDVNDDGQIILKVQNKRTQTDTHSSPKEN